MTTRSRRQFALLLLVFLFSRSFGQWFQQNSGTTASLNDIFTINSTTAVAVGDDGMILKTTDAGNNWIAKPSGTANRLNRVGFGGDEGYAVGNGVLSRTTDAGETWVPSTFPNNFSAVAMSFWAVYVGDDAGVLRYSSDGGVTWNERQFSDPLLEMGIDNYVPPMNDYVLTMAGRLHTWHHAFSFADWDSITNPVGFWDELTGGSLKGGSYQYLVGYFGNPGPLPWIARKYTFDSAWVRIGDVLPAPFVPEDIEPIIFSSKVFTCGSSGRIFVSTDYGDAWVEQTSGVTTTLNAISFVNEDVGFAVGEEGTILYTLNGGTTSVDESLVLPEEYFLYQNYPNPFNPSTTFSFDIPFSSFAILKVYDIIGREVATLVNEDMKPGSYHVTFDASGLASGVYLYRLTAGSFSDVKKLLVLR